MFMDRNEVVGPSEKSREGMVERGNWFILPAHGTTFVVYICSHQGHQGQFVGDLFFVKINNNFIIL